MKTIDRKDLTIGSYMWDVLCQPHQIDLFSTISICDVEAVTTDTQPRIRRFFDFDELKPIPLTTDWLLQFGFVQDQNKYELWREVEPEEGLTSFDEESPYLVASVHHVFSDTLPFHFLRLQDSDERIYSIPVSYVHQLQALLWHIERVWLTLEPPAK